jgi:excisionase family DNA binding protein
MAAPQHHTVDRLLTVPEAAAALRVSKWTLYQLIRSRRLGTIKIGARRLVPTTALDAFLAQAQAEGAE